MSYSPNPLTGKTFEFEPGCLHSLVTPGVPKPTEPKDLLPQKKLKDRELTIVGLNERDEYKDFTLPTSPIPHLLLKSLSNMLITLPLRLTQALSWQKLGDDTGFHNSTSKKGYQEVP